MPDFSRQSFPSCDGVTISYLDSGRGDQVALLLHGFLVEGSPTSARRVAAGALRRQLSDAAMPESLRAFERPVMVLNGAEGIIGGLYWIRGSRRR